MRRELKGLTLDVGTVEKGRSAVGNEVLLKTGRYIVSGIFFIIN